MTEQRRRILVVGAGVAGLTMAIALHRSGHDVTVAERASGIEPLGAGLVLWSNAVLALRALELDDATRQISAELSSADILDPTGRVLSSGDMRAIAQKRGAPTLSVHRAELLPFLASQLPKTQFQFNRTLTGLTSRPDGVIAHFADGSSVETDILIGADGIWSTVRRLLHGDQPARYSGYVAWRAVVDLEMTDPVRMGTTETWGAGCRFGWVPLTRNRVYWFATMNAAEPDPDHQRTHLPELLRRFGDWHSPIPETLAATEEASILFHGIYDRKPLPSWGKGHVTLAGDAAHPMTPNTGQGAATAIEDAVVLADCLSHYQTVDGALRGYEARRFPRTKFITDISWRIGQMTQFGGSRLSQVRNAVTRWIPERISQRQLEQITDWTPPG